MFLIIVFPLKFWSQFKVKHVFLDGLKDCQINLQKCLCTVLSFDPFSTSQQFNVKHVFLNNFQDCQVTWYKCSSWKVDVQSTYLTQLSAKTKLIMLSNLGQIFIITWLWMEHTLLIVSKLSWNIFLYRIFVEFDSRSFKDKRLGTEANKKKALYTLYIYTGHSFLLNFLKFA